MDIVHEENAQKRKRSDAMRKERRGFAEVRVYAQCAQRIEVILHTTKPLQVIFVE